MSRTITLATANNVGVAGAKQSITERFDALKTAYIENVGSAEMTWTGDVADVEVRALGQEVGAKIEVTEAEIRIDINLPWLLANFAGPIEAFLKANADIAHPGSKPGEAPIISGPETPEKP